MLTHVLSFGRGNYFSARRAHAGGVVCLDEATRFTASEAADRARFLTFDDGTGEVFAQPVPLEDERPARQVRDPDMAIYADDYGDPEDVERSF